MRLLCRCQRHDLLQVISPPLQVPTRGRLPFNLTFDSHLPFAIAVTSLYNMVLLGRNRDNSNLFAGSRYCFMNQPPIVRNACTCADCREVRSQRQKDRASGPGTMDSYQEIMLVSLNDSEHPAQDGAAAVLPQRRSARRPSTTLVPPSQPPPQEMHADGTFPVIVTVGQEAAGAAPPPARPLRHGLTGSQVMPLNASYSGALFGSEQEVESRPFPSPSGPSAFDPLEFQAGYLDGVHYEALGGGSSHWQPA